MEPVLAAWDGLAHSLSSPVLVSSAASAFDRTHPQTHIFVRFPPRPFTVSANEQHVLSCFIKKMSKYFCPVSMAEALCM